MPADILKYSYTPLLPPPFGDDIIQGQPSYLKHQLPVFINSKLLIKKKIISECLLYTHCVQVYFLKETNHVLFIIYLLSPNCIQPQYPGVIMDFWIQCSVQKQLLQTLLPIQILNCCKPKSSCDAMFESSLHKNAFFIKCQT